MTQKNISQINDPKNVNRRHFLSTAGAGLAYGMLSSSSAFAADSISRKRHLYVTSDRDQTIEIYDINRSHKHLGTFKMNGDKVGGMCADAATNRYFISQQNKHTVSAYDLLTGKQLWSVNILEKYAFKQPDRISITADGSALYVPVKQNHTYLVLDPATGEHITEFERPGRPHNSWSGEQGRYMYCAGRSHHVMYMTDQKTHKVVKKIGPFSWPVRPFAVDREERFIYANTTYTQGFSVGNIKTGETSEVNLLPPYERTKHWMTSHGGMPHGDHPFSHGIGVRPVTQEVWHLDDLWGYLNVFDTSKNPAKPKLTGRVELFDDIKKAWNRYKQGEYGTGNRWVAFSIDGKYCYPSDGSVVDCDAGNKTNFKIVPSEKLFEVEFQGDQAVRVSGQMGGVYGLGVS
jgi:DNA-binding beta-propeller fold protein YncE